MIVLEAFEDFRNTGFYFLNLQPFRGTDVEHTTRI